MDNVDKSKDENVRIQRLRELDRSKLPPDGGPSFNRLIFSSSPYLLQHAENPVDWHPWTDEAFARAKKENKPVFLSIGYATCHWCHVMAHESFEDLEVAKVLNDHFVSIKVDREERPDIDDQYMKAAQIMIGNGGWPLNVVMTPDRRPFFAATYLPRFARAGMAGVIDILMQLSQLWRTRRREIEKQGSAIVDALSRLVEPEEEKAAPGNDPGAKAYGQLAGIYDRVRGGFGREPKFPMPLYMSFLLRYGWRRDTKEAIDMAGHTLRMMRRGGIYDQIGYGFHRYSVDRQWLVPHFEKMLYDQALLAIAYLEYFQIRGEPFFLKVAQEIFEYGEREMTAPEGGFYSGLDADSEGHEGTYYLWTPEEVESVIGSEAASTFCRLFGITKEGNFEGRSIPFLPLALDEFSAGEGVAAGELTVQIEKWRLLLLRHREKRIRPLRDEKILTAWNGLMIAALARGYGATGEKKYLMLADRAIAYIKSERVSPAGRLLRLRNPAGENVSAFLEDYAFFSWGLIECFRATLESSYLEEALRLTEQMLDVFGDSKNGGLFDVGHDAEKVLIRVKSCDDGVMPSGNSTAAMNLLTLGRIKDDKNLIERGEAVIRFFMGRLAQQPAGSLALLAALDTLAHPPVEITLTGAVSDPGHSSMMKDIGKRFLPDLVIRRRGDGEKADTVAAYVCAGGACHPPIHDPKEMKEVLDAIGKE